MTENKYLIVARCGKSSLHEHWTTGSRKNFDLLLCSYESVTGCDDSEIIKSYKWHALYQFFLTNTAWRSYDYICMPDDDILADSDTWSIFFDRCRDLEAALAAPALTPNSYFSHVITLQNEAFKARATTFVEIMTPCMSREFLEEALTTLLLQKLGAGYGLDFVWPYILGFKDIWIIDETPVRHTRPVGSNYSRAYRQSMKYDLLLIKGFGIPWEMRSVGGYTISDDYISAEDVDFDATLRRGYSYVQGMHPNRWKEIENLKGGARPEPDPEALKRLGNALSHISLGDSTISRGKPCLVSSVFPGSWSDDPAVEATGGNDGLLNGAYGFHTNWEVDPWWQVDLLSEHEISSIILYNWLGFKKRCIDLDVHVSADGQKWRTIHRKRDGVQFGGLDGFPLRIALASPERGRIVRIQACGKTFLHLDQVEIFGNEIHNNSTFRKLLRMTLKI